LDNVNGKISQVAPSCAVKAFGGVEVWLHSFLTLTLDADKWPASPLSHLLTEGGHIHNP